MAHVVQVIGAEAVKQSLKSAGHMIGVDIRRNLIRAGLFVQRESQKIVPVDTANLKNSAGTKAQGLGWNTEVIVFYTAAYAVYVHERTDVVLGVSSRSGGMSLGKEIKHKEGKTAKFLEIPTKIYRKRILAIIAGKA